MIAAWMMYALLVGVLVGGGALVLERLVRAHRLPTRWIWVGAMLLSGAWPLGHALWKSVLGRPGAGAPPAPDRVVPLEPLAVEVSPQSFLRLLDGPILLGWAVASGLLISLFLLLILRTRRLREGWRREEAAGKRVLVSEDWGPAVVGFLDPQIVLPRWYRELDGDTLRLVLDHEAEHLRAGDLRLLLLTGVLPVLMPWNVPLWWQLSRLRIAVEGDCDLRVLRRHPHRVRPYLELLLEVGGRLPRSRALAAMLSEPEETLERRIHTMTMPIPKNPWARGVILASLGSVLIAVACWAPGPTDIRDEAITSPDHGIEIPPTPEEVAEGAMADEPGPETLAGAPTFTPFTVRPHIRNRAEVARALEREYPPLLRDAGIGGTATVWFYIDAEGVTQRTRINESVGHQALDDAALRVAEIIEFTPALNRDEPVPVWISLPVTFSTTARESGERRTRVTDGAPEGRADRPMRAVETPVADLPPPPQERDDEKLAAAPTFTPFTVRPDIRNRAEVARALEREYPPLLRDAGIGGTATVWFYIDAEGVTQRTRINESVGHQALDDAALRVAEIIEFTPALNRDEPVPVWISLPITFTTR